MTPPSASSGKGRQKFRDSSFGMPVGELPRIWDRDQLYRGDKSRSQRGLGLSRVKVVVQAHRGQVEVSSNLSGFAAALSMPHPPAA
jgi:signal transduction histidine kinase